MADVADVDGNAAAVVAFGVFVLHNAGIAIGDVPPPPPLYKVVGNCFIVGLRILVALPPLLLLLWPFNSVVVVAVVVQMLIFCTIRLRQSKLEPFGDEEES